MDKANILVIEDDMAINQLLVDIFEKEGYEVKSAYSGTEGKLRIEMEAFDLVILDLMLPGMSGEELIKTIRASRTMPIIVASAKVGLDERVNVLRLGADDFISKPFNNEEVLARAEAQLRRYKVFSHNEAAKVLKYNGITLDLETFKVYIGKKQVELTAREFNILKTLMEQPKRVFTRASLFETVWGDIYMGDDNTLNVHMSNLRSKLTKADPRKEYIETIWGIGFKMSEEN